MTRWLSRRAMAKAYSATTVFPAEVWAATSTLWPAGPGRGDSAACNYPGRACMRSLCKCWQVDELCLLAIRRTRLLPARLKYWLGGEDCQHGSLCRTGLCVPCMSAACKVAIVLSAG